MIKLKEKTIVVKFGGKSLATPWNIKQAAESVKIARQDGHKVVVVVSAIGRTTDLLQILCEYFGAPYEGYDDILSSGELISAKVFSHALASIGVQSHVFTPFYDDWPILTDSAFRNASLLEESVNLVKSFVLPILDSNVAIVPGFIGKDKRGRVTTLGRGSSDLTLFFLAHCIDADEVIKVTDVSGVYDESRQIQEHLSVQELKRIQARSWVIIPKALEFFPKGAVAKVISHEHGRLDAPGTIITGGGFDE